MNKDNKIQELIKITKDKHGEAYISVSMDGLNDSEIVSVVGAIETIKHELLTKLVKTI